MPTIRVLVGAALLVLISLSCAWSSTELAQTCNLKGMEAYRLSRWDEAAQWFREALKDDPNHKFANYNLACVLARLLSSDHRTWEMVGADPDNYSPFEQLKRAIAVDPEAGRKAAHDPDFVTVRLTPEFQRIIGADLNAPDLIKILLVAQCEWFGRQCGAWCRQDLIFFETGEVKKRIFTVNERGQNVIEYRDGRYSVESGAVILRFGVEEALQGRFAEDGALEVGSERYILDLVGDL